METRAVWLKFEKEKTGGNGEGGRARAEQVPHGLSFSSKGTSKEILGSWVEGYISARVCTL